MKLHALVGAALIATSFALPAFATDSTTAAPAGAAATKSSDDQAVANLKAHVQAARDLWSKIKGLKAKGKNASKAEIAKARAQLKKFKDMCAEAKAEGHAAKMLALSAIVAKMESDLNKIDPMGAKNASDK